MNRLIGNLYHSLQNKIDLYDRFIHLLQEEWDGISTYSMDSLEDILQQKEKLVLEMQVLDDERASAMKKIEKHLGMKQPALTLKKLIEMREDPMNGKLSQCRKRLLVQIDAISEMTLRIKGLMEASALSLKKSMAYVHAADQSAVSPYRSNGQVLEGKLQGKMVSMDV